MKTRIITALALAAIVFASCSKSDPAPQVGGNAGDELRLSAVTTRAVSGTQIPATQQVGLFIAEDAATTPTITYTPNLAATADGLGGLTVTPAQYYPTTGNGVKISAYSPYNGGAADSYDFNVAVDQSTDAGYNASDLLFSASKSYAKQAAAHTLAFDHKLARINYTLTAGAGAPNLTGAVVTIVNTKPTAEFNRATGALGTATGAAVEITPNAAGTVVVPQSVAAGQQLIKVVTTNGNDYYYKPTAALALEAGKSYNFTLTVNETELSATYTVTDWSTGTVGDNGGVVANDTRYRIGSYYPDPNVEFVTDNGGGTYQKLTDVNGKDATDRNGVQLYVKGTKPIGVVFWVDPLSGGTSGKIVSLDEGFFKKWRTSAFDEQSNGVEGIRSFTDGYTATRNLIAKYSGESSFASDYPAFEWIYQKNGSAQGAWYLPAKDELSALYTAWYDGRTAFNDKLTAAAGMNITTNWYWSSTENGNDNAWGVYFNNGFMDYVSKVNQFRVRAVLAF